LFDLAVCFWAASHGCGAHTVFSNADVTMKWNRNHSLKGTMAATAVIAAIAATLLLSGGCAQTASSKWAQSAPIIRADFSAGHQTVSLGARE
jgi:hypothetical protein